MKFDICFGLDRLGSNVKVSWKLISISKLDNQEYKLTYETPEGQVSLQTKSVVMTIPSHIASGVLRPVSVSLVLFYYCFILVRIFLIEKVVVIHFILLPLVLRLEQRNY